MRTEQLEYLTAVTRHGSLRRTSEQLHISQPALSEALRNLERELGVSLLDRSRTGTRISRQGRELLPQIVDVMESIQRLRTAAGDQSHAARLVRIGTVNAATSTLLVPAVRALAHAQPETTLEIVNLQQEEIHRQLAEGALDLGLVNLLDGDDPPTDLRCTRLLHGRPALVCRADHRLAAHDVVGLEELRTERFVAMRAGYLMHRFVHRVLGARMPPIVSSTDGAEMGKLMVAEGLGVTVLPDYSVAGDPLVEAGLLTYRPLDDETGVDLVLLEAPRDLVPLAVRELRGLLVGQARAYRSSSA